MKTVLLRLEGPLQSWGTRSRFGERDTELEPSKSGVLGLVGSALGMQRDDDAMLLRLASARFGVRADREGRVLKDYHSVGGGRFRGREHLMYEAKHPILTSRDYLQDASFLGGLCFEDEALAGEVFAALNAPIWPLYLGRKACPPSLPVHVPGGVLDADLETALRTTPYPRDKVPVKSDGEPVEAGLRMVLECPAGDEGAETRQDQPLSFRLSNRHFARRYVKTMFLPIHEVVLRPEESPCISLAAC